MVEGGDQNAMLGVGNVSEANAASQQTLFIVSGSPSIHCGGEPNDMLGVTKVLRVKTASHQTLFIVSGSPSNLMLGEVTQMLCWGNDSPGG